MSDKIEPGVGWRLLKEGDTVLQDDEVWTGDGWFRPIRTSIGSKWTELRATFRRRIEDRWIPLSEKLPDKFPVEVWSEHWRGIATGEKEIILASNKNGVRSSHLRLGDFTHWHSLRLSDPPEPEVSESDLAYNQWADSQASAVPEDKLGRAAWHAALAWERGRKKE